MEEVELLRRDNKSLFLKLARVKDAFASSAEVAYTDQSGEQVVRKEKENQPNNQPLKKVKPPKVQIKIKKGGESEISTARFEKRTGSFTRPATAVKSAEPKSIRNSKSKGSIQTNGLNIFNMPANVGRTPTPRVEKANKK